MKSKNTNSGHWKSICAHSQMAFASHIFLAIRVE
uniref:Uncharacterized protein n=1 Tax=Rhizophora mucronata TaxID=61149 RepID=A0A2P2Q6K3_RHIMU